MKIITTLSTTGHKPHQSSIVEIQCLVINDNNQIIDTFSLHTKPNPNPKTVIDNNFLDKAGIQRTDLQYYKDFDKGFESFKTFLEKYKDQSPFLVVWNKMYVDFLVYYCNQNNLLLENYVNKSTIDLLPIFTFFLHTEELGCYTLESICNHFGMTFKLESIHKVKILYTLYCKL